MMIYGWLQPYKDAAYPLKIAKLMPHDFIRTISDGNMWKLSKVHFRQCSQLGTRENNKQKL